MLRAKRVACAAGESSVLGAGERSNGEVARVGDVGVDGDAVGCAPPQPVSTGIMSANAATSIVVSGARCDDLDRVRDEGKWRGEAELIMPRLFHGMATFHLGSSHTKAPSYVGAAGACGSGARRPPWVGRIPVRLMGSSHRFHVMFPVRSAPSCRIWRYVDS